jgi:hypothetical protein
MEFEYMIKSEEWGGLNPFRSITLSCSSCDFLLKKMSPRPDEPLGYLIIGTILGFDRSLLYVEIAPPPPKRDQLGNLQIRDEKTLILKQKCDPILLETYKRSAELVEILVVGNVAVRVEG